MTYRLTRMCIGPAVFMVLVLGVADGRAAAPAKPGSQARDEFAQQRLTARQTLESERRACYQRFAVTDCIEKAESTYRDQVGEIRRQELALNEEERKARTAARVSNLESKAAKSAQASPPRRDDADAREAARQRKVAEREAKARRRAEQARKREVDAASRRQAREQRPAEATR